MKRSHQLFPGILSMAALAAGFCIWSAFGNEVNLCVTSGCALFQDTSIAGISLWWAGGVALCMPSIAAYAFSHGAEQWAPWFNAPAFNWLGLVSRKPFTQDYVPVFPWLGVMWWGMASGQWLLSRKPGWLQRPLPGFLKGPAVLGRWSLSYYMVHQPVLMGGLMAFLWLSKH